MSEIEFLLVAAGLRAVTFSGLAIARTRAISTDILDFRARVLAIEAVTRD